MTSLETYDGAVWMAIVTNTGVPFVNAFLCNRLSRIAPPVVFRDGFMASSYLFFTFGLLRAITMFFYYDDQTFKLIFPISGTISSWSSPVLLALFLRFQRRV